MKKYSLEKLQKHTLVIRSDIAKIIKQNQQSMSKAFDDFDAYVQNLEKLQSLF